MLTRAQLINGIPPLTADQVREHIATKGFQKATKSARIKLAEMAITFGNITDEGKQVYRELLKDLQK